MNPKVECVICAITSLDDSEGIRVSVLHRANQGLEGRAPAEMAGLFEASGENRVVGTAQEGAGQDGGRTAVRITM